MNPFDLSASDLLIWGVVLHLIADWPLQNDWMANNKAKRGRQFRMIKGALGWRPVESRWFIRHPAAYVHAGIHGILLAVVFGWVSIPLAVVHLIIDTRVPVVWWSKLVRQTQPPDYDDRVIRGWKPGDPYKEPSIVVVSPPSVMYIGTEVRFWTDQMFHIACIAVASLLVTL